MDLIFKNILNNSTLWALKSVEEDKKATLTIDNYDEDINEEYNYDSSVQNYKNIKVGDYAIILNKKNIFGFAKIGEINSSNGVKTRFYCPICKNSTLIKRTTLIPKFKCNNGHTFEVPFEKTVTVTKFNARFDFFIKINEQAYTTSILRPYYSNNYNKNMSMQVLDHKVIQIFSKTHTDLINQSIQNTLQFQEIDDVESIYKSNGMDEREVILRSIKLRRGQKEFRDKLIKRFKNTCIITRCKISEILEAAHINPYRGHNDNHLSNGILIRADIHTLFDLNLIGIEPNSLTIQISEKLKDSEYKTLENKQLKIKQSKLSSEALIKRWENFLTNSKVNINQ